MVPEYAWEVLRLLQAARERAATAFFEENADGSGLAIDTIQVAIDAMEQMMEAVKAQE